MWAAVTATTNSVPTDAEGIAALRQALAAEGMEYMQGRYEEEYLLAMNGRRRVAEKAGMAGSDLRAFLSHQEISTGARLVADALSRRDQAVYVANRHLAEWRRAVGARFRSLPQSLHQFEDR